MSPDHGQTAPLENLARPMMASVRYIEPLVVRPYVYCYDPPPGVAISNYRRDVRVVRIEDARPFAGDLPWEDHGFRLADAPVHGLRLSDHDAVRSRWYSPACDLVRKVTKAKEAVVFDHTFRKNIAARDSSPDCRPPVTQVHVDGVDHIAAEFVRQEHPAKADRWLNGRWQIINVWRPLVGPVVDSPLAFCDGRSIRATDLVPTDLYFPEGRIGLTYQIAFHPNHQWRYIPEMTCNEVVLFKCYDSKVDASVRFVPHSAFEIPDTPPSVEPRQSIEIRIFAYLGG